MACPFSLKAGADSKMWIERWGLGRRPRRRVAPARPPPVMAMRRGGWDGGEGEGEVMLI